MSRAIALAVYTRRPRPQIERLVRDLAAGVLFRNARHTGPAAVADSLRRGLRQLGVAAQWNPPAARAGSSVAVLADPVALRVAIEWRRSGRIARLLAGPNIVMSPQDEGGLIAAPEVDLCVVPSAWVADYYSEQAPSLARRIAIWPAGVDVSSFRPPRRERSKHAIVYRKLLPGQRNASDEEVGAVRARLQAAGWRVSSTDYGSHSRRWYRGALAAAGVLVFFSPTESQGLALQEAWAMDVPTLVWDGGTLVHAGGERRRTSSAPYLTERTGVFFTTPEDFSRKLAALEQGRLALAPRAWVEEHGSDAASASAFLELLELGQADLG